MRGLVPREVVLSAVSRRSSCRRLTRFVKLCPHSHTNGRDLASGGMASDQATRSKREIELLVELGTGKGPDTRPGARGRPQAGAQSRQTKRGRLRAAARDGTEPQSQVGHRDRLARALACFSRRSDRARQMRKTTARCCCSSPPPHFQASNVLASLGSGATLQACPEPCRPPHRISTGRESKPRTNWRARGRGADGRAGTSSLDIGATLAGDVVERFELVVRSDARRRGRRAGGEPAARGGRAGCGLAGDVDGRRDDHQRARRRAVATGRPPQDVAAAIAGRAS